MIKKIIKEDQEIRKIETENLYSRMRFYPKENKQNKNIKEKLE